MDRYMKKEYRKWAISCTKNEVNDPKERLMEVAWKLEEMGAHRDARKLWRIIKRLEIWQFSYR